MIENQPFFFFYVNIKKLAPKLKLLEKTNAQNTIKILLRHDLKVARLSALIVILLLAFSHFTKYAPYIIYYKINNKS